MLPFLIRK